VGRKASLVSLVTGARGGERRGVTVKRAMGGRGLHTNPSSAKYKKPLSEGGTYSFLPRRASPSAEGPGHDWVFYLQDRGKRLRLVVIAGGPPPKKPFSSGGETSKQRERKGKVIRPAGQDHEKKVVQSRHERGDAASFP